MKGQIDAYLPYFLAIAVSIIAIFIVFLACNTLASGIGGCIPGP